MAAGRMGSAVPVPRLVGCRLRRVPDHSSRDVALQGAATDRRGRFGPVSIGEQLGVDYQIHGVLAVRLVDAPSDAFEALQREIGPLRTAGNQPPDLSIRFVDAFPTAGEM